MTLLCLVSIALTVLDFKSDSIMLLLIEKPIKKKFIEYKRTLSTKTYTPMYYYVYIITSVWKYDNLTEH